MSIWQTITIAASVVLSGYLLSSASAQSPAGWLMSGGDYGVSLFNTSTNELTTCRVYQDGAARCKTQAVQ